jgi:copper chaperone NosL
MHARLLLKINVLALLWGVTVGVAGGQSKFTPQEPNERSKCPVCGMFVLEYPRWWSEIIYEDGTSRFFDGPKDMLKFFLRPELYEEKRVIKIAQMYVRDYYSLHWIEARQAWYVLESDVYGPMGNELVPLQSQEDAVEFRQDHQGKAVLQFDEINWDLLMRISEGDNM